MINIRSEYRLGEFVSYSNTQYSSYTHFRTPQHTMKIAFPDSPTTYTKPPEKITLNGKVYIEEQRPEILFKRTAVFHLKNFERVSVFGTEEDYKATYLFDRWE